METTTDYSSEQAESQRLYDAWKATIPGSFEGERKAARRAAAIAFLRQQDSRKHGAYLYLPWDVLDSIRRDTK